MARPDEPELRRLYELEALSCKEIARRLGVSNVTVARWLKAEGISMRDGRLATKLGMAKWQPNEQQKQRRRESSRRNIANARSKITPASHKKQSRSMKGRPPPNKGKPWSEETAVKHAYRQTDEYRERQAVRQRGALSPNWRGGQTDAETLRMQGWEWRQRRKECYARDNWTCRDCNVKCSNGIRIAAHHIIPRRHGGGDELENLLTLCGSCHPRRESLYRAAFIA